MEKTMFQIWHKKSKKGTYYTAVVAVDKYGKLSFNFDLHIILLTLNAFADLVRAQGFSDCWDIINCERDIVIDCDKFKERS